MKTALVPSKFAEETAARRVEAPSSATPSGPRILSERDDVELAARALGGGAAVAFGFANHYAIASRADADVVAGIQSFKGQAPGAVSVTTTPAHIASLFDWSRLPKGLARADVETLMKSLFAIGPCGFRGPAADHVPDHLASKRAGVRTVQVIAPGYRCPSNDFLARALAEVPENYLHFTSASRAVAGADEPAHWCAEPLVEDLGGMPGFVALRHRDEAAARRAHPLHAATAPSAFALHTLAGANAAGRPILVMERQGSLPFELAQAIVESLGFALLLGLGAQRRLAKRDYRRA